MGRTRRTTRNQSVKANPGAKQLTPEEIVLQKNLELHLKDFDKQVKNRQKEIESLQFPFHSIRTMFKVELMKLGPSISNMKWDDYVARCSEDGSNPFGMIEPVALVIDDVIRADAQIEKAQSAAKNTVRKRGRKPKNSDTENEAPIRRSARKRNLDSSGEIGSNVLANTTNLVTPATKSTRGKNAMKTPSVFARKPDVGMTPLITPKFNPMTPLNKTVSRAPRPNEVLISVDGSPVAPTVKSKVSKAESTMNALIPLGTGQTLNMPVTGSVVSGLDLDLDDEARSKLLALHQSLGDMLKIRDLSSAESDT